MIWSTLEASLIAFYYRSLGAKIAGSASVVGLIGHPADMDLIEIGSDARISFIFIDSISNSTQTRNCIVIEDNAEVGALSQLSSGVRIGKHAQVNAALTLSEFKDGQRVLTSYGPEQSTDTHGAGCDMVNKHALKLSQVYSYLLKVLL